MRHAKSVQLLFKNVEKMVEKRNTTITVTEKANVICVRPCS